MMRLLKSLNVLAGLIVFSITFYATSASMYTVGVGATVTINEWGVCWKVTNNTCGASIMVPTNTAAEWASFYNNLATLIPANCASKAVCTGPPTALSLSQTANSRDFTVSWTGGSGNGGVNGCKLQYYTGAVWTDLTFANYNCDANATNVAAQLNGDGFAQSTWATTGLQIRLVRISDSTVMGTFATKATCAATGGSGGPTPTVDEDCDTFWDNSYSSCNSCTWTDYMYTVNTLWFWAMDVTCTGTAPYGAPSGPTISNHWFYPASPSAADETAAANACEASRGGYVVSPGWGACYFDISNNLEEQTVDSSCPSFGDGGADCGKCGTGPVLFY